MILSHPNLFDLLTECHELGENENATSPQSRHGVYLRKASDMNDLTGFQRDLLYVIRGLEEPHGLALKYFLRLKEDLPRIGINRFMTLDPAELRV